MDEFGTLYKRLKEHYGIGRGRVKSRLQRAKFSRYYFTERKKIDWWNRSVRLLQFGFFRLTFRLHRDFKSKLYELFLKSALPLYKIAERTVKEGWQWDRISIREYNIIVFFADFCNKMLSFGESRSFDPREFSVAEEAYLKLVHNPGHMDLLESAFLKVFEIPPEGTDDNKPGSIKPRAGSLRKAADGVDSKRKDALGRLLSFLATDDNRTCFVSYSLAFSMVTTRSFITYRDLTSPEIGSVLPTLFYQCPPEVFKSILTVYRRLNLEIKKLQEKITRLEWLDRQSSFLGDQEPEELVAFYNSSKGNWLVDSKNYYGLHFSLVRRALTLLERTLFKEWEVMNAEEQVMRTRIIDNESLGELYEKVSGAYVTADGYYRSAFPTAFSLMEFRAGTVHDSILATKPYHELKEKLDILLTLLFEMAESLEDLSVDSNYSGTFLLRYMIVRPISYRGKSVMDLLTFQVGLLSKICRFFLSTKLVIELKSIDSAREELAAKQTLKEHIDANRVIEELMAGVELDEIPNGG